MFDSYACLKPVLMRMDAESAHRLALSFLKMGLGPRYSFSHPALETRLFGKTFSNPLGLAAGFDKDAEAVAALFAMGFGFVEAGTVTPFPQKGNPRPRIFRDTGNESVINRMGFPGQGLSNFEAKLHAFKKKHSGRIVGANIGINKDAKDALASYKTGLETLGPIADYVAVNVSSPNTVGLRSLQAKEELDRLLGGLMQVRGKAPLLLKVAPDLEQHERADVASLALKHGIDGLIVSNTTVTRPSALAQHLQGEKGGLSGRLLRELSTEVIRDFYGQLGGRIPIIGVGGIGSAQDAYARIRAGASLVQVYSALVFRGPRLVADILEGLPPLLKQDGYSRISEAVGADSAGRTAVKALG